MRLRHLPLFWLGLLPVVVLLWAWADSMRYVSGVEYCRDGIRSFRVRLFGSSLRIDRLTFEARTALSPGELGTRGILLTGDWGNWIRYPYREDPAELFPRLQSGEDRTPVAEKWVHYTRSYIIPLWLLLLAWLPLWLGATWWQARRKARKLRAAGQGMREAASG